MRKIILFNLVSLDGFFEGSSGDIDWHNVDDEFNDFAIEQLESADGLIFGRVTYEMMAGYWPTAIAAENDPIIAEKMNTISKTVFSRTLEKAEWKNTRLVRENILEEIAQLKQQPGKDILIFGSAKLGATLTQNGSIDEYRIMVNPVILGEGRTLFGGVSGPVKLMLLNTRTFWNGNVLLSYAPVRI
jgi:dihydrofolate reductase